jgi:hypothetical protein
MSPDQETAQHLHRFEVAGGPQIFYAECACGHKLTRGNGVICGSRQKIERELAS